LRICYLSDGNSIHDVRLLNALSRRGLEMHLISFHLGDLHPSLSGDVIVHHFRIPSLASRFLRGGACISPSPLLLKGLLNEIESDVVHSTWLQSYGFYAAVANYRPILSMPFGSDVLIQPDRSLLSKFAAIFALSRADLIACDAESVKNKILTLVRSHKDNIVVFPRGVDISLFRPSDQSGREIREELGWEDKLVVVHDRSFEEVYGIEYLVEAIPLIVNECPEARFLFCGTGRLETEMRMKIRQQHNLEYVRFMGYVENSELPRYLNSADVYVSSSLSDGTSISLLEAMACGLPVVLSDVPSNLEWVTCGYNGMIVPRKSPQAIAQAVLYLLKRPEVRKRFGRENLKIARERADWKRTVATLIKTYARLASGEHARATAIRDLD
jgi:glycosyltransferase involved in cell wall biosynthesis